MFLQKPIMGWNSWNTFGAEINEQLILETADAMVSTGLKDAGYQYVIIDDAWCQPSRENGHLVPDRIKFPHGMKYIADHIHSKGLKFGMYSCSGYLTCLGLPASYGYEQTDAADFASWEIDYLKYDYCHRPHRVDGDLLYRRMGNALANCGRDIVFAACSWGADGTPEWIRGTGASTWRSTGDIYDSWASIRDIVNAQKSIMLSGAPNCFNDMDMLVVGMRGKGNVGISGCTDTEYRTHFALWSFFASPLIIGCDIRNMDKVTLDILTNKQIISVDQDPDCRMPLPLGGPVPLAYDGKNAFGMSRLLSNGDIALGMFNLDDDTEMCFTFSLYDAGLDNNTNVTLTDMHTGETLSHNNGYVYTGIKPHDCKMIRIHLVK